MWNLGLMLGLTLAPPTAAPMDPALKEVSNFVGGKWVMKKGITVETQYEWNDDHQGFHSEGLVTVAPGQSFHSRAMFGWDPVAKKPYYLDCHDSITLYYGHISLDGKQIVFRFGVMGAGESTWIERGAFTTRDHYEANLYEIKGGKEVAIEAFVFDRKP